MTLLIDSNVFLWWTTADWLRLRASVRQELAGAEAVFMSLATVWELEIKRNLGKLKLDPRIWSRLDEPRLTLLSIEIDDVLAATALPLLHRDPFDRMIVAQAMRRGLTLVTADAALADYGVAILKA